MNDNPNQVWVLTKPRINILISFFAQSKLPKDHNLDTEPPISVVI